MAEEVLTTSEVLEIMYNSDKSLSDSCSDSVSGSDNENDDTTVADAIINDDSGDEEEILHEISGGRLWTITQDTEKCSVVILDPEMAQKM